jgi:alpha 1,3-glucosidase
MEHDPFTLRVALDEKGSARGELYLDDGESFLYRSGQLIWREFVAQRYEKKVLRLSSHDLVGQHPAQAVDGVDLAAYDPHNAFVRGLGEVRVEKVVVVGLGTKPKSVKLENGDELDWRYAVGVSAKEKKQGVASVLTIKDPHVLVAKDWAIVIQW